MPNGAEVIECALNDFQKVQAHMMNAKRENAVETNCSLKNDYISSKVLLSSLGVNLTEIDKITHDQPKKKEEYFRSSLSDLCKILNSNGLEELLQNTFTLIQDETNWSPFYDQDTIRSFVNDKIITSDISEK